MQYRAYGVTGGNTTCCPFCYLSRSPILATAMQEVTEVTGLNAEEKKTCMFTCMREKIFLISKSIVTSVTSVTYYSETIENTNSVKVTDFLSRSNFSCYPKFPHAHDHVSLFFKRLFLSLKSSVRGGFQNMIVQRASAGGA